MRILQGKTFRFDKRGESTVKLERTRLGGEEFKVLTKRIYHKDLTSECWSVQFWGLPYCRTCDYLATEECGGQRIRKLMLSGKYPVNGLPDAGSEG